MQREPAIDALRAWAMLAGVAFHAALAHSPLVLPYIPSGDRNAQLPWVDGLIWGLHLVRMPLFFVIAGYGAAALVQQRGVSGLMRNRARRVLIPLLVVGPLLFALMSWSTLHAARTLERPSPLLGFVRQALDSGALTQLPPSTMHLWFLYYLLIFSVGVWLARALLPAGLAERLHRLPAGAVWLGLPLLLAPALASVSAPHPAPESLLPQFWALCFFGAFFSLGYLGQARPAWLFARGKSLGGIAAACALLYPLFLHRLEAQASAAWPLALLSACLAVGLLLLALALAQRWLSRPGPVMGYLSDAAYWVYLTHLPFLFSLQYALLDATWPALAKLALAFFATLAVCLLSFELLVRRGPLGPWLLGRRALPTAEVAAHPARLGAPDQAPPSR